MTSETFQTFDILKWWSSRTKGFPILSLVAKDVLAAPASGVEAGRELRTGDSVLDATRSEMSPDRLELQCLLGDWARAELRIQGGLTQLEALVNAESDYDTDGTAAGDDGMDE